MVSGIVRQLENAGESEVNASTIGNMVMDGLKALDDVAYVRFASVYKDFREARDFEELLGELSNSEELIPKNDIHSTGSPDKSETS